MMAHKKHQRNAHVLTGTFQQTDREQLYGLIEQSPFGILVTASATGLEANLCPSNSIATGANMAA
jgi:predicted FMN-binding regulatory protein PaiB